MVVGGIFWVMFSIVYGIIGGLSGETPVLGMALIYLFGMLFFFSLPVTVIIEIVNWAKRRRARQVEARAEVVPAPPSPMPQRVFYCRDCGKPLTYISQYQSWYCENCKAYAPS